jgi:hypothetical protein
MPMRAGKGGVLGAWKHSGHDPAASLLLLRALVIGAAKQIRPREAARRRQGKRWCGRRGSRIAHLTY